MAAPAKLLFALTAIIFLLVTLVTAQTTSSSSSAAAIATDICEACRDGDCASGVQFCGNGNSSSSRFCCCPESTICEEEESEGDATSICKCFSISSDKLQTNFLLPSSASSQHGTASWVFLGIGAALVAALIAFTIYYKLKKRQIEKSNNNQQ